MVFTIGYKESGAVMSDSVNALAATFGPTRRSEMANKSGKKANVAYSDMQKKDMLAKWDGTAQGAKTLKVPYRSLQKWRDGASAKANNKSNAKAAKPAKTSAFDDALGLLLSTVHIGRLKSLPRESYGEELKRVRVLQRVVTKAVAEGNAAPAVARSLAKHFDALIEGL